MAKALKRIRNRLSHEWLVLDEEHRRVATSHVTCRTTESRHRRVPTRRQIDTKRRSCADDRLDIDPAAMLRNDTMRGGEPEPRPASDVLRREEWLEDASTHLRR